MRPRPSRARAHDGRRRLVAARLDAEHERGSRAVCAVLPCGCVGRYRFALMGRRGSINGPIEASGIASIREQRLACKQRKIRIGTRGSPLALAQAREVRARLDAAHGLGRQRMRDRVIKTTGDRIQDRPLTEAGGKGLFTKEIEEALLAGDDRPRRAFHEGHADRAAGGPDDRRYPAARGSARRLHQRQGGEPRASCPQRRGRRHVVAAAAGAGAARCDPTCASCRCAATSRRACASWRTASPTRRSWPAPASSASASTDRITAPVPTEEMLPAVAQGAIGIEIRADDDATAQLLAPSIISRRRLAVAVERAFLAKLDGSCRTPIAGLAELAAPDRLVFRGMILTPDGRQCHADPPRRPPGNRHRHGRGRRRRAAGQGGAGFLPRVLARLRSWGRLALAARDGHRSSSRNNQRSCHNKARDRYQEKRSARTSEPHHWLINERRSELS